MHDHSLVSFLDKFIVKKPKVRAILVLSCCTKCEAKQDCELLPCVSACVSRCMLLTSAPRMHLLVQTNVRGGGSVMPSAVLTSDRSVAHFLLMIHAPTCSTCRQMCVVVVQ